MKLLVTGGAGFIGSNFIHFWLKNHPSDDIVNLDKLTYAGNLESLRDVETNPHYKFLQGDITDIDAVNVAIHQANVVVHFAAESHVDRSILGPGVFVTTNVIGTQVLLDAALEHEVERFIHISTDEVFGDLPFDSQEKFNETSPYSPSSPYAASKAGSDHLARAYHRTFNLPVIVTNCSNNYGPYQFPEKFISLAITNIIEGKKAPLYGAGKNIRDWLYVEDHCRAIETVLSKGEVGETYCVGGLTNAISNKKVLAKVATSMGKTFEATVELVKDRPGHDRRYAVDWSKINRELGWKPLHDFDTWLQKTIEWYKANEPWWKPLKEREQEYFKEQYEN
ncbi:MAG: dTDP-glucose 4,6-dehydratase [Candidatus Chisholmbacteria bacterium]|nr:dTDP-glucose 4,6-dehydratase [Candidatus Chisholmbacteria bacterium]